MTDDESQPLPGPPGPRGEEFIFTPPFPQLGNGYPIRIRYYPFEFGGCESGEKYLPTSPGTLLEFGGGVRRIKVPPRWRRRGPGRWLWRAWSWARYGGLVRSVPWRRFPWKIWQRLAIFFIFVSATVAAVDGTTGHAIWFAVGCLVINILVALLSSSMARRSK